MVTSPRAVITVGASAGGVTALKDFVRSLPADLPAAVLVVLHLPAGGVSALAPILDRAGPLPAVAARDAEPLVEGRLYTAVPDHHLVVVDSIARLSRGPTENRHRPAVDALFRSAALEYGPRVAGVVLSGALDDGADGLAVIKACGGLTVVQDPVEAAYRGMPDSALARVRVDHVLAAGDMGPVLAKWLAGPLPVDVPSPSPMDETEAVIAAATRPDLVGTTSVTDKGTPSGFTCPDCRGTLFEIDRERQRYRCRVGHAWTARALLRAQSAEIEHALWTALRALEEKRELAERLRERAADDGHTLLVRRYGDHIEEIGHAARTLRGLLYDGLAQPDGEEVPGGE